MKGAKLGFLEVLGLVENAGGKVMSRPSPCTPGSRGFFSLLFLA